MLINSVKKQKNNQFKLYEISEVNFYFFVSD